MSIRSVSKAIIISNNNILLNQCVRRDGSVYYALPGGGQHQYENMEKAVIREVREETGYQVRVVRLAGVVEEIEPDEVMRSQFPEYTHRIMHLFIVEIVGQATDELLEKDFEMDKCIWFPITELDKLPEFVPHGIKERLVDLIYSNSITYWETNE